MAAFSCSTSISGSSTLWFQTLSGLPEAEKEEAYKNKILSVSAALKKYKLSETEVSTIALKYRLNCFEPGYTKKTTIFTAVSVAFIEEPEGESPKGSVEPGLYLLLKKRDKSFEKKRGRDNHLTRAFHWETESLIKEHAFRNCEIKGLGRYEIEVNRVLAPYPQHFATGIFIRYITRKKPDNELVRKVGAIIQYHKKGNLQEYAKIFRATFKPEQRLEFIYKIAAGIQVMHSENFVHLDLKPGNIVIDNDENPLIIDFGFARPIGMPARSGTRGFISPQLAQANVNEVRAPASTKDDVWSYGCILSSLYSFEFEPTRLPPLLCWCVKESKDKFLQKESVEKKVAHYLKGSSFPNNLIKKCLAFDPEERLSMKEVLDFLDEQRQVYASNPDNGKNCVIS